jgi:hypothetical protein
MLRPADYRHLKDKENPDTDRVLIAYGNRMGPQRTLFSFILGQISSGEREGVENPLAPPYSAATACRSTSATISNMIRFSSKSLGV